MEKLIEREIIITYADADLYGICKTSALMMYLQECATEHSAIHGVSRNQLMGERNCFWMLTRMGIRLIEPVYLNETLTIRTWCRTTRGVSWIREFELLKNGNTVGWAVSNWVICNFETRKLVKVKDIPDSEDMTYPDKVADIEMRRARPSGELEYIGKRKISYSDLDINAHVNNTKYADIIVDHIFEPEDGKGFINELSISYIEESKAGDVLELFSAKSENNSARYVCGCFENGKKCFEAEIKEELL